MTSKFGNLTRKGFVLLALGSGVVMLGVGAVKANWEPHWRHHGGDGRRAGMESFCSRDTARYQPVARAYMKADLQLNDSQSAEFEKLADTLLPALTALKQDACKDLATNAAPAPERLEKLAALLHKAADAADKAVQPSKQFYATLDEKQKARVDELSTRGNRGMNHRGGRGDHGRDGPNQGMPGDTNPNPPAAPR